jgi:hypothetical protein
VSNTAVSHLVIACAVVFGLAAFGVFVVYPAVTSYRGVRERIAAAVMSLYVLAALVGVGVVVGGVIIIEWPRLF